ncbi:DNA-binding response regulator [Lacihabitans sp. LS3-19]|uniref:response regulator n=1 Tax=Lacihabitans sp. LS3-19 TaxID=2487335 RepID=UPI0020CC43A7|nr:response regulator transcription factor [Lacihabitans sp. LS3-19]MCP9769064.1 DNA-binding response regulator [Lacihabitans sp. LS3-19]
MKITEICIIEDHKIVRDNLRSYLELHEEFKVGLVCGSAEEFFNEVKHANGISCEILLLDIGLPKMSGIEALPLLLELKPELNIIILSSYEEEDMILKAICNGACSYISKKTSLKDIVDAIRVVIQGGSYMSPSIAREIINHLMGGRVSKATILSERQKEILEKMVDGKTYTEISTELFISVETVRSHIKKMYKVLHVNNKSEAISMYLKGQIK